MKTLFKYEFKRQKIFLLIMIFVSFLVFLLNLDGESTLFSWSTFKSIASIGVIGTVVVIGAIGIIRSLSEDIEDSSPLIATIPLSGPKIMAVKLITTIILIGLISTLLMIFNYAASLITAYVLNGSEAFMTELNYTVQNISAHILSGIKTLIAAGIYISILYLAFVIVKAISGRVSFFKVAFVILALVLIFTIATTLIANVFHFGFSFDNGEFFPAYILNYDRSISSTLNGYYKPYADVYGYEVGLDTIPERYHGVNNINIIPTVATVIFTGLNLYLAGKIFDKKVTF